MPDKYRSQSGEKISGFPNPGKQPISVPCLGLFRPGGEATAQTCVGGRLPCPSLIVRLLYGFDLSFHPGPRRCIGSSPEANHDASIKFSKRGIHARQKFSLEPHQTCQKVVRPGDCLEARRVGRWAQSASLNVWVLRQPGPDRLHPPGRTSRKRTQLTRRANSSEVQGTSSSSGMSLSPRSGKSPRERESWHLAGGSSRHILATNIIHNLRGRRHFHHSGCPTGGHLSDSSEALRNYPPALNPQSTEGRGSDFAGHLVAVRTNSGQRELLGRRRRGGPLVTNPIRGEVCPLRKTGMSHPRRWSKRPWREQKKHHFEK